MDFKILLENAGWIKGRTFDISEYEKVLKENGYVINGTIRLFLQEYGGLRFEYDDASLLSRKESFDFDVIKGVKRFFNGYVESYSEVIKEKLVIIGTCKRGNMCLLMSHSGKVFAAMDDILLLIGNDYVEGINNLINGIIIRGIDLPEDF